MQHDVGAQHVSNLFAVGERQMGPRARLKMRLVRRQAYNTIVHCATYLASPLYHSGRSKFPPVTRKARFQFLAAELRLCCVSHAPATNCQLQLHLPDMASVRVRWLRVPSAPMRWRAGGSVVQDRGAGLVRHILYVSAAVPCVCAGCLPYR